MKKLITLFLSLFLVISFIKSEVVKWETITNPSTPMDYYIKATTPGANWTKLGFEKTTDWKSGYQPIGFGSLINSCSSCLIIPQTTTIYARTKFTIKDTSHIEALSLFIDYMDGVVAYINGVEVARANMGTSGTPTTASQTADITHFLGYYSQEVYQGFYLDKKLLKTCLKGGDNMLAIEVHNDIADASQALFYSLLYAGLKKDTTEYDVCYLTAPFPVNSDSSKLPIVKLDFSEPVIPDNPRITAELKIIDNGEKINHFSDSVYSYSGKITIERRGSASQQFPKHSYGFTTIDELGNDTSISLLGLPKESDWVLKGEMEDRTQIRDELTYDLARRIGHYAPRSKYCELYINGVNMGLFAIMEKIKRDTFRVDIAKLKDSDNSGLDVTGGYILKIDKTTGTSFAGFTSKYKAPLQSMKPSYQFEYPKGNKVTAEQKVYIKNFIYQFEDALRSENFKDKTEGYRKYISVKSFIDYMISQEIARNVDGYRISTFFYKEKDKADKVGKIHMGPLWDFNLAYGYSGGLCSGSWSNEGWGYDYNKDCPGDSYYIPFWWDRLLQDPSFRAELKARWDELRAGPLHKDSVNAVIDSMVINNRASIDKNNLIWSDVFKNYIWPNDVVAENYDGEITYLKNFISDRIDWIDTNIPEIREEVIYTSTPELALKVAQVTAYPMPFDENLNFGFYTEAGSDARIKVYNTNGQLIYTANTLTSAGQNTISWDGTNNSGAKIKPGVYMYTLELDNAIVARSKIIKK